MIRSAESGDGCTPRPAVRSENCSQTARGANPLQVRLLLPVPPLPLAVELPRGIRLLHFRHHVLYKGVLVRQMMRSGLRWRRVDSRRPGSTDGNRP